MADWIPYLIKVALAQAIFYLFYRWVLRALPYHGLNRVYLLITLLLSLVIPFIPLSTPVTVIHTAESAITEWIAVPAATTEATGPVSHKIPWLWLTVQWLYLSVIALFVLRSFFHLFLLQKIQRKSQLVSRQWFSLFKTAYPHPFSFFSRVFIPAPVFGQAAFGQILAHECVHVRQLHSADRLLLDFVVSVLWFNPFIYLYRNALIEIHEFQADAQVIKQFGDPIGYQEMLFASLQPAHAAGPVSHFNFSTIKRRIVMMNKPKPAGFQKLAHLSTLPLIAVVLFAFTSREAEQSAKQLADRIERLAEPPTVAALPTDAQEDRFKPSILPLKTDAVFKVSSHYGWRNHPKTGERKMHNGMDLAAPIGTEVLSTADGIVTEVGYSKEGYGNHVVIKHGNQYVTKYAQLSKMKVTVGDQVEKGQVIALSGNSGQSTGPHLHYEVYKNGKTADPKDFIRNYTFAQTSSTVSPKKVTETPAPDVRISGKVDETTPEEVDNVPNPPTPAAGEEIEEIPSEKVPAPKPEPLYIINGVRVDNVSTLSPEAIREIIVMKGEKAKASYGADGENGVVVIYTKDAEDNTKKAKRQKN